MGGPGKAVPAGAVELLHLQPSLRAARGRGTLTGLWGARRGGAPAAAVSARELQGAAGRWLLLVASVQTEIAPCLLWLRVGCAGHLTSQAGPVNEGPSS